MNQNNESLKANSAKSSIKLTIYNFIKYWSRHTPYSIAIEALHRLPLTYYKLHDHVLETIQSLNEMGISRNDRVAVMLPNGPEMAVTFLAVASGATCAPLNPSYKERELGFFLSDLNVKALIVPSTNSNPDALKIAAKLNIKVIKLTPQSDFEAGLFLLESEQSKPQSKISLAQPNDVAIILHTSGTTSRPKIVPLEHSNLCISANNIRRTLHLTETDKCLNIMPLFHIHGLIGAVLSSISAGASIVCTPGYYAPKFIEWVKQFNPTWYSAVPTMHQSILSRLTRGEDTLPQHSLRLIRSSSSALPPQIMAKLEKAFQVPVIESYGMTEAAHQMASNPLPPKIRKPGTVGVPAGPDIAIVDEQGVILPQGEVGEIVIKGLNVIEAYENNPEANEKSFTSDWFRTGDEGYFDEDNYLVITDRIKEIINRGGEKISPREIDEVLLDHPAIEQAVTFAVPDDRLGEEIAAAIVVKKKERVTSWDIQSYVAKRLANFKVPRDIVILGEIPKGPTGKLQRIGLAEKLGLVEKYKQDIHRERQYKSPTTRTEKILSEIWSNVLQHDPISVDDNFFQLGGDSILAGQIVSNICKTLNIKTLPLAIFLHAPTIEKMAELIDDRRYELPPASLVAIQPNGRKPPIYFVHACWGEVLFLSKLAKCLGFDQPFYALRARGLDGKHSPQNQVEDMAANYLEEILATNPDGPFILGGAGVGGLVAYEMSQILLSQGQTVLSLLLVDTLPPDFNGSDNKDIKYYFTRILFHVRTHSLIKVLIGVLIGFFMSFYRNICALSIPRYKVFKNILNAVEKYEPKIYPGRAVLIIPQEREGYSKNSLDRINGWFKYIKGDLKYKVIPGKHLNVFEDPYAQALAEHIRQNVEDIIKEKAV